MSIEQTINYHLNRHPGLKKGIKRAYQRVNYALSSKVDHEGDIVRISPDDPNHEYFFGYYDKSPEDATGRYVLCLKAQDTWSDVAPAAPATLLFIDTEKEESDPARVRVLAESHTWNVQQGCMMQWLGPDFNREIIYNDFRDGKYVSVVLDVFSGAERVLAMPVYSVSQDGSFALTLDFSRLHRLRPGYGYSNLPEETASQKIPESTAIWKLDIKNNVVTPVLPYTAFSSFEPRKEMTGAEHKVNHIMLSPSGRRFMVLHRWFDGQRKYTRLVTVNTDGSGMYNLSDDDMVSHCYWKNDDEIIAFENKKGTGIGYYLMKDLTQDYEHLWPHISSDGHPSYSPDGRLVLTDTYPNRKRMAILKLLNRDYNTVIARVFAPFKYDNDTRCDLHPRWSRDGKRVYIDSVFEGHRGLYMIPVEKVTAAYTETTATSIPADNGSKKLRILYVMTSCRRCGPTQQTLNIIKNLDHDSFDPYLITLYDEETDGRLYEYLPYVREHYLVKTGKLSILRHTDTNLQRIIAEIKPDVVHTVGLFPDYAIPAKRDYKQVTTIRNYVYDDYPKKYGRAEGWLLAKLHLKALKSADKPVCCSESLSKIYKEKLGMSFDFIRNGVDVDHYTAATVEEKQKTREKMSLPADAFIFIYTGQFIERKNIPFLLENCVKAFGDEPHAYFLLLGGGPELEPLKEKYKGYKRIDFRGNVSNVNEYLKACDVYVSTSKSEGLPNGVLEAMATGVPVVLSDIDQHKEIYEVDDGIGYLYKQGDGADLIEKLKLMYGEKATQAGQVAYDVAHKSFSAPKMSQQYQAVYKEIVGR